MTTTPPEQELDLADGQHDEFYVGSLAAARIAAGFGDDR